MSELGEEIPLTLNEEPDQAPTGTEGSGQPSAEISAAEAELRAKLKEFKETRQERAEKWAGMRISPAVTRATGNSELHGGPTFSQDPQQWDIGARERT